MIARLEVWDPQDTVLLHSIQLDPMDVDEDHPYLVAKGDDVTWSRYHLGDVVVGVNIEEDTAWTGPLNVTCQVTSTERSWPEVTQSVLPSGLFEDLTCSRPRSISPTLAIQQTLTHKQACHAGPAAWTTRKNPARRHGFDGV